MNSGKNIAVFGSHISWDGGIDFLCFLIQGILKKEPNTNLILVLPHPAIAYSKNFILELKKIAGSPALFSKIFSIKVENKNLKIIQAFKQNGFKFEIAYYNYTSTDLIRKFKKAKADIIFPSIKSFGTNFPVPYLGYIPDLQHKYFPDFFSEKEKNSRDNKYAAMLKECKAIIVNSIAVKDDLIKFYQASGENVFTLPFTPPAPLEEWKIDHANVVRKYKLPSKFFLISNQFWKHKSHITAFEALSEVRKQEKFKDYYLVCTGKLEDDRFPEYSEFLKRRIKELGITDRILFLGFIPKADQIQIMKHSIALLQPSMFEGGPGGGATYNAVSLGVPAIISDIPVNQEIQNERVFFFKAGSAESLSDKLAEISGLDIRRPSFEQLVEEGNKRTLQLGTRLFEIIEQAKK